MQNVKFYWFGVLAKQAAAFNDFNQTSNAFTTFNKLQSITSNFLHLQDENKRIFNNNSHTEDRRDGVMVRASASQSVYLGCIPLVESYQKTLKNGIYSFPAWRSAFMEGCREQAGKFACCVLGQGT